LSDSSLDKDYIVVIHGIARTYRSMRSLAKFLKAQGYPVLNVDYPSTRLPLESLVEHVNKQVTDFNQDHHRKIHFVGYSLSLSSREKLCPTKALILFFICFCP
jgi:triacylglycerol esterase/lipase EstA (alpha/beta hydrolase family)